MKTLDAPLPVVSASDSLFEFVDGRRMEKAMGYYESSLASILAELLARFVRERGLGRVRTETLFRLNEDPQLDRRPDVAFVSYQRWPKERRMRRRSAWDVVPDLAVEVQSPHDTAEEIQAKIRDYFGAGVRQVWVLYPSNRDLYVYDAPTRVRIFAGEDTIDAREIFPGLNLKVVDIFEDELEADEG